jgi:hypothetical protein
MKRMRIKSYRKKKPNVITQQGNNLRVYPEVARKGCYG